MINVIIAGAILVGLYFFTGNAMSSYTQKGHTVTIPDIVNVHINDLPEVLEKKGFRYELLDSTWNRKKGKGIILEQNPEAGVEVKEGRKIYIKINARTNKKIKLHLENVVGGSRRGAMEILSSMDVVVDSIQERESDIPNIVLAVENYKGKELVNDELIFAGSKLVLVVSKTGETDVKIPSLIGLSIREAQYALLSKNLTSSLSSLQSKCREKVDSTIVKVAKQLPKAHKTVKTGTKVSIFYDCDSIP